MQDSTCLRIVKGMVNGKSKGESMRKYLIGTMVGVILILTACAEKGVSQEKYDALVSSLTQIEKEKEELNGQYDALSESYQAVVSDHDYQSYLEDREAALNELSKIAESAESLEGDIASMQEEKEALKDDISNLKKEIAQLQSDIAEEKGKPIQLVQGMYIVGEDIEAGKYKITAVSGNGNIQGSVASLGTKEYSLNEILAVKGDPFYGDNMDTYNNLRLEDGDKFTINNGLVLEFQKLE